MKECNKLFCSLNTKLGCRERSALKYPASSDQVRTNKKEPSMMMRGSLSKHYASNVMQIAL